MVQRYGLTAGVSSTITLTSGIALKPYYPATIASAPLEQLTLTGLT